MTRRGRVTVPVQLDGHTYYRKVQLSTLHGVMLKPCDCETVDDDEDEIPRYPRICAGCGSWWYSLHCPHDGHQNPCPQCGATTRIVEHDNRPQGQKEKDDAR